MGVILTIAAACIGTPPEFRDMLICMARSATFPGIAAAMADQCGQAGRPGEMRAK